MYRKSTIARSFVLPTILLSMLLAVPLASAYVITNHSGTICKNYNQGEANLIDYATFGTRTLAASPLQVICPLTRGSNISKGAFVYVAIRHNSNSTTKCTAYSYTDTGGLLAAAGQVWTGIGFHEFQLNLVGPNKSLPWSDYSVLCTIPGGDNGIILGVDLLEQ